MENKELYEYVTIAKGNNNLALSFSSKNNFFETPIVYKITENYIKFRKQTLDDRKKVIKPYKSKYTGFYTFPIPSIYDIPFGRYNFEFDEEDKDIIFIYYNDK